MILRRAQLPSLSELIAFELAARHGSFTRAAEDLNLTQGAVSRQIAALEDTLGLALFERVRRSVRLTDAGRMYLVDVERILGQLADATERVASFGAANVLNLAVLPTFATRWLMPRLPRFLAMASDVTVNCLVRLEPFDFEIEPFDAAIHFGSGEWSGAQAHFLCRETIVLVASPDLAARIDLRSPTDVIRATRLHQTTRPDAWRDWFAAQGMAEPADRKGPRIEQFGMIVEAAIAGVGAALVPSFLVREELAAGRLFAIASAPIESRLAYWLVVPERKRDNPLIEQLRLWMESEVTEGR